MARGMFGRRIPDRRSVEALSLGRDNDLTAIAAMAQNMPMSGAGRAMMGQRVPMPAQEQPQAMEPEAPRSRGFQPASQTIQPTMSRGRPGLFNAIARPLGYTPDTGMTPLQYIFRTEESAKRGRENVQAARDQRALAAQVAEYDQMINGMGLSPQETLRARMAMRQNPEEFGKNLATGFGTNVLAPGSMLSQGFGVAPVMNPKGEELPDSVRALQKRADLAGLAPGTPEYREFMMRGGAKSEPTTVINTGVPKYYEVGPGINPATGQRGMFGINPQTGQFEPIGGMAPLSGTSAEFNAKAQSMLPQAFTGLATITNLFKDGKSPLNAVNEQAAEYAQNIPVIGPQIAKTAGGKEWQAFNQAWAAIKQTVHIPAGAAVSAQEFQSFIDANKPALGDNDVTVQAKLRNTALFLNGLSAAAAGDPNGVRRFEQMYEQAKQQSLELLNPSQSQLTPEQQAEGRALEEELRRLQGG
jgi:hypothetical protein